MLLKIFAGLSLPLAVLLFFWLDAVLWALPLLYLGCLVIFLLLAVVFLCLVCAPVDIQKPQHEDSPFYRAVMYLYIELLIQLVGLKVETNDLTGIPKDRRFLMVCNHQNESDPGILLHFFRKGQMAFISKKENATMPFVGKFMHKTLCQMVNRENDREALKTILKCIQLMKEDKVSICAFPEGGIIEKDKLTHFRSGMFKIAQKTKAPIVVCTMKGTSDLFHNMKRLKRTTVRLHLVGILPEWEHADMTTVEIAERVYDMMITDLGEEYRPEGTQNT